MILDILYFSVYNGILLLFCLIAFIAVRKGRYPWGWYMIGAAIQGFAVYGSFTLLARSDAISVSQFVLNVVSYVIILVLFGLLINRTKKKSVNRKNGPVSDTKFYVCVKCGQLLPVGVQCDCGQATNADHTTSTTNVEPLQKKPSHKVSHIFCVVLAVLLCVVGYASVFLANENRVLNESCNQLETEIEQLRDEVSELKSENRSLKQKAQEPNRTEKSEAILKKYGIIPND